MSFRAPPLRKSLGMGRRSRPPGSDHIRKNRRNWERSSNSYERRHARALRVAGSESWGLFRIPEARLKLLGEVRGRDVLEVGCGAAMWSIALARRGAHCTGIDLSRAHLRHAAENLSRSSARVGLLEGNAERLPFPSGQFDLVFCDWGALSFADPDRSIPEAARVLRVGGRLVFSTAHPLRALAQSRPTGNMERRLSQPYFGFERVEWPNEVEFRKTFGGWVALFRENGLELLEMVEPRAPPRGKTSYLNARDHRWARDWPMEAIWKLRRVSSPARVSRGELPLRSRPEVRPR
jgi:ubiquinone/menaquinone biosynthesis C-methylase UbiE